MKKRSAFLFLIPPLAVCSAIALAAAGRTVYYNDQVLTQNARQIDGMTYVPLADVARALGGRVAAHGGGLRIVTGDGGSDVPDGGRTAPGGANEVRGANGNIGDWFFNGYWRFRVNGAEHTDEYHLKNYVAVSTDKPDGPNDELVVFHCTIKNGRKVADEPILTPHGTSVQNTALTDDQGQSYAPTDFDVRGGKLLPGAAKDFAVIFSVPKGTNLKDLIFTLYSYGESIKASNVRVSVAGQ